jgi:hypothetical protein
VPSFRKSYGPTPGTNRKRVSLGNRLAQFSARYGRPRRRRAHRGRPGARVPIDSVPSSTKYQSVIALWKCQRIVSPGAKVKRRPLYIAADRYPLDRLGRVSLALRHDLCPSAIGKQPVAVTL